MTEPTSREILDRLITIETMVRQLVEHRDDHESRMRTVEQSAITEERVVVIAQEQADARQQRALRWVALVVAVVSSVLGAATGAVLGAILS